MTDSGGLHPADSGHPAVSVPCPRHRPALRLYGFPPAGAGADLYLSWPGRLPASVELAVIHLPGRGALTDRPSWTDPAQLSAALADLVASRPGPAAFFGHSSGALLAYETARRLQRSRRPTPLLLALSALPAPHTGAYRRGLVELATAEWGDRAKLLGEDIAPAVHTAGYEEAARVHTPLLADLLLLLHYRYRAEPPLDIPLALYGGSDDLLVPSSQLTHWNDLFTTPTVPCLFPGTHSYPATHSEQLLARLSKDLNTALGRAA